LALPHPPSPSFFDNEPAPSQISTLSLHDALPISATPTMVNREAGCGNFMYEAPLLTTKTSTRISTRSSSSPTAVTINPLNQSSTDRKSTRLNSSHVAISYAVFCLKKKKTKT